MSVLVWVDQDDDLSLQALAFARGLGEVRAVSVDGAYQPVAWATALAACWRTDGWDRLKRIAAGKRVGRKI